MSVRRTALALTVASWIAGCADVRHVRFGALDKAHAVEAGTGSFVSDAATPVGESEIAAAESESEPSMLDAGWSDAMIADASAAPDGAMARDAATTRDAAAVRPVDARVGSPPVDRDGLFDEAIFKR